MYHDAWLLYANTEGEILINAHLQFYSLFYTGFIFLLCHLDNTQGTTCIQLQIILYKIILFSHCPIYCCLAGTMEYIAIGIVAIL